MATDWAADVKKYVANADDAAIAGIVRYCGIALRSVDSSLVAFSDKTETDRVRNNFLKKKLALTQSDAVLDKSIAKVGEMMKADRTKNRVTVYYLLAAEYKKLGLFVKAASTAKAPAAKAVAAKAPAAKPAARTAAKAAGAAVVAGAAAASKTAAKPAAKAAAKPAAKPATKTAAKPAAKPAAVKTAKTAKTVPAKAAPAKAAAKLTTKKGPAKTQGLMDNAAKPAPKAEKPATGAVAGTIAAGAAIAGAAVAAASGAADAAKDTAAKAIGSVGDAAGAVAGAAGSAADKVGDVAGAAADKAGALFSPGGQSSSSDSEGGGMGWLLWLLAAALLLFALWWMFGGGGDDGDAAGAAPTEASATLDGVAGGTAPVADLAAAPAEGTVAIPAGAGVTTEMRDGKPVVKVYFDTSKTDVAPAFAATAGGLRGYLDSNPGSKLAISGFSDPSGNAAANAELSKSRAQAVQTALVDAGIPADAALLVKPENSADGSVSKEAARRVEVSVQ